MDVASRIATGPVFAQPSRGLLYRRPRTPLYLSQATKSTAFEDFFTKRPSPRREPPCSEVSSVGHITPDWKPPRVELTQSDDEFLEQGLEFVEGPDEIDLNSLNELFVRVRFPRRDLRRLRTALENTYLVLWIRYTLPSTRFAKQGQILGFARVISDGAFYASIWDVAVSPAWQRGGLGRGLMERLLLKLTQAEIQVITLYAERDVVALYEKLGFRTNPDGIKGMAYALGP